MPASAPSASSLRTVFLGIGALVLLMTIVFGTLTTIRFREFTAYRRATLENPRTPPPWKAHNAQSSGPESNGIDVEACVDWTLRWSTACQGLPTLCASHSRNVMMQCLQSADRQPYCAALGRTIETTGFGYQRCLARYHVIADPQLQRVTKNDCAAMYRVIADHCRAVAR